MSADDDSRQNTVKFSISMREDVYDKLRELIRVTGLDRSGVLSLLVMRARVEHLARDADEPVERDQLP